MTGGDAAVMTKDTPEIHHGAYGLLIHLPPSQDVTRFSELFQPKNHLPGWHSGKESACQCRRHRRHGFDPRVGKIPWSRKWRSTPVLLPGKSHGQKSLVGYSPWGHKELDMTDHTCRKPLALLWKKKKKKQILRPPLILLNIT